MPDTFNETIQDIAVKHGVVLGKDDPILILYTMNERLLEENRKAQQAMLAQFKEEMESISSQWKYDARDKAEKVLNAALSSSKEAMNKIMQETINESALAMIKMITGSLAEAHELTQISRKTNRFTLLSSAAMLTASCTFMFIFLSDFLR